MRPGTGKADSAVVPDRIALTASSTCYPFFTNIPKAKWYTFSGCSHMPMAEEPKKYNQVIGDFLVQK